MNTPIHEFGHLWNSFIYKNNKKLWNKGAALVKGTTYWKKVNEDPFYSKLTTKQKVDEALAMAIGDRGESLLNKNRDKGFRAWLKEVWDWSRKYMGIRNLTADEVSKLTFEDFINGAVADLLSDKKILEKVSIEAQLENKINEIKRGLRDSKTNPYHEYQLQKQAEALEKAVLENNIISLYKSVYGTGNTEINKLITSTLNTDFAGNTANLIDSVVGESNRSSKFTVLSPQHQKNMLDQGSAGQLGISVHSAILALMGVIQQSGETIQFLYKEKPFKLVFGDLTTEGIINKTYAEKPKNRQIKPRSIATINMENQNVSVDNQKLLIMAKRNENKYTINAFSMLSGVLGIDNDGIMIEGSHQSYPSLFMSQPILRRYVELAEYYNSYTTGLSYNAEELIEKALISEFGEGVDWSRSKEKGIRKGVLSRGTFDRVSEELTSEYLYDNLLDGKGNHQWAVYTLFKQLNYLSSTIRKLQSFINIEGSGLGKSFFDVLSRKEFLLNELPYISKFELSNVTGLVGEYFYNTEGYNSEDLEAAGYVYVGEDFNDNGVYIKPTTPQGHKIINAITQGNELWSNVFPFESKFIKKQIDDILFNSNVREGTQRELELKYKILSEAKDYLYSACVRSFKMSKTDDINLFMDTETNQSLASYLCWLKVQKHPLMDKDFFRMLEFEIEANTEPSLIKLNASGLKKTEKSSIYNLLNQLSQSDEFLPDFNGKPYTYQELIRDLARYSLISNQEGGAIGFRQYIPLEIFDKYGVTDIIKATAHPQAYTQHNLLYNSGGKALELLLGSEMNSNGIIVNRYKVSSEIMQSYIDKINRKAGRQEFRIKGKDIEVLNKSNEKYVSNFVKQFFQHNPEDCRIMKNADIDTYIGRRDVEKVSGFVVPGQSDYIVNDFVSVRGSNGKLYLYQNIGNGSFLKVGLLGHFGMNEYDFNDYHKVSIFEANKEGVVMYGNSTTAVEVKESFESQGAEIPVFGIRETLERISNSTSRYKDVASFFSKYYDPKVKIEKRDDLQSAGAYSSKEKTIYLNSSLWNTGNQEANREVFLHEYIHSLTEDLIKKYVNLSIDEDGKLEVIYYTDEIPRGLSKLISVYKFAVEGIIREYGLEKFNELNQKFKQDREQIDNEVSYEAGDMNAYYSSDINEFIAGIFFNENFREKMTNTPYKATEKSLLRNFVEALLKMYNSLFVGEDNVAQHTVDAVVDLLEMSNAVAEKPSPLSEQFLDIEMINNDVKAESLIEETFEVISGKNIFQLMEKHDFPDNFITFYDGDREMSGIGQKMYIPGYSGINLYHFKLMGVAYIVNMDAKQVVVKISDTESDLEIVTAFADWINNKITNGEVGGFEEGITNLKSEVYDAEFIREDNLDDVEEC
jgi:hypothetical protein